MGDDCYRGIGVVDTLPLKTVTLWGYHFKTEQCTGLKVLCRYYFPNLISLAKNTSVAGGA
jgi:hypothetical protein